MFSFKKKGELCRALFSHYIKIEVKGINCKFLNNPATNIIQLLKNYKIRFQDHEKFDLNERKIMWLLLHTVHKVLMHGKEIIDAAVLTFEMLSEEAEEARNKDY